MSAFVAFSQMGFYPVTPGIPAYNIVTPFFKKSTVDLGNGNHFANKANGVSEKNKYIQSAKLNGAEWNKPWFSHHDIENGGLLELEMGPERTRAGEPTPRVRLLPPKRSSEHAFLQVPR